MKGPIKFYTTRDEFGAFSNFSKHQVTFKGITYKTSEAAYQAQKFKDKDVQAEIQRAKTPGDAAKIGRDKKNPLRKDWENVKVAVMLEVLWAKFTQHPNLKELLLSTDDREIIEHTTRDSFWGDGGDGSGKNMLGKCLMRVRSRLRENK